MDSNIPHSKNGRLVTLNYNINDVLINEEDLNVYLNLLVNKLYAILGVYEDCEESDSFDNFYVYLNRVLCELKGCSKILDLTDFMSLTFILSGLEDHELTHRNVKSIVFHCIGIVKKNIK